MTRTEQVKRRILLDSDMDYAGICPSAVLEDEPRGRRPSDLLPNAKSILVFGRKLISGSVQTKFRQFEDGVMNVSGSYSAHSFVLSVNHLCMNETYNIAQDLENTYGCFAMPLTNNVLQAVQPEGNYAPFFADPMKAGLPLDIYKAAVAAGIGEMGWNHRTAPGSTSAPFSPAWNLRNTTSPTRGKSFASRKNAPSAPAFAPPTPWMGRWGWNGMPGR